MIGEDEQYANLMKLQLAHMRSMLDEDGTFHASDDGCDYMTAAIDLSGRLLALWFDQQYETFDSELTEDNLMDNYACDGVAPELWAYATNINPTERVM